MDSGNDESVYFFIALLSDLLKLWIELFQVFFDEKKKVKVMSDFRLKSGSLLRGENDVEIELENVLDILKVRHSFLSWDFSSLFIHDLDLEIVL